MSLKEQIINDISQVKSYKSHESTGTYVLKGYQWNFRTDTNFLLQTLMDQHIKQNLHNFQSLKYAKTE